MCHRSPLTVQGRSPLLLLLLFFFILSSLSLSPSFSHPSLTLSLLGCSFLHLISFYLSSLSVAAFLSLSLSLVHCLPRLSSFICPSPFILLPLSLFFTDHHLCLSLPPLFFSEHLLSLHLSLPTYAIFYLSLSSFRLLSFYRSLPLSLLSQVSAVHLLPAGLA